MDLQPFWRRTLQSNWFLIVLFLFLIIFPHLIGWLTDSSPFGVARGSRMIMRGASVRWQAVLIEVFILSILAMSYNLLFGFTGVISFGHSLYFGMGGYILGMALEQTSLSTGTALILGGLTALVVSAILGLISGLVSLRLRGVYFAIFTLAVAEMFYIYFGRLRRTNAEDGFSVTDLPVWLDPSQSRLNFYYIALALFIFTFLFIRRLVKSPTGAVFQAIRENEDRAQTIGYNTLNYKLFSIMIAGMLAATAGMLQVLLNKKVGPELLSINYTIEPLLATIIGGIGTFTGPVIGAGGLHLMDTFFRDSSFTIGGTLIQISKVWGLILGSVFILVVLIFPQGFAGSWARWRVRFAAIRQQRTDQT